MLQDCHAQVVRGPNGARIETMIIESNILQLKYQNNYKFVGIISSRRQYA